MKPETATSFRPPWGLYIWSDSQYLYCEIPAKSPKDPPLVMKFLHTEGGLGKALALLTKRHAEALPKPGHYKMPEPKISNKKSPFNEETHNAAREILKRMGII